MTDFFLLMKKYRPIIIIVMHDERQSYNFTVGQLTPKKKNMVPSNEVPRRVKIVAKKVENIVF